MKKKILKYLYRFLFVVVILIGIFFGITGYFHHRTVKKMTPEMRKMYEEWMRDPVNVSLDDLETKPFSEETIKKVQQFSSLWEKHSEKVTKIDDRLTTRGIGYEEMISLPFWPDIYDKTKEVDQLTTSFIVLINRPDFEIDALSEVYWDLTNPYRSDAANYLMFQATAKILRFHALEQIRRNNFKEAFDFPENILKAAKAHEYSVLITRLIAVSLRKTGVEIFHYAVDECDNPEILKNALQRQRELIPFTPLIPDNMNVAVTDQLGVVRVYHRIGVDAPKNLEDYSGRQIFGLGFKMNADYRENIILPTLTDPGEIENIESQIDTYRTGASAFGARVPGVKYILGNLVSRPVSAILFAMAVPNFQEANARDKVSIIMGDILHLETALKLFRLETGQEPESLDEVVNAYLDKIPKDIFSEKKEPLKFNNGKAYSIGPDKTDQGAKIQYDPTNGTLSGGDIFFK